MIKKDASIGQAPVVPQPGKYRESGSSRLTVDNVTPHGPPFDPNRGVPRAANGRRPLWLRKIVVMLRRLLLVLPTVFGVLTLVFFFIHSRFLQSEPRLLIQIENVRPGDYTGNSFKVFDQNRR